jgi:nucleoside-diphosphate-sugar epimerase
MRVVVTGATGNVGSSLLRALSADPRVEAIVGLARRAPPELELAKVEWRSADIVADDLVPIFDGADAVVHLAWLIQPSRDQTKLRAVNVDGSARVFDAVSKARVTSLIYASSVGAYSPGPKDRFVDELWPTNGIESSFYARHKAEVERMLDEFERGEPGVRVVRLRPGLIFKDEAATEIRRLFVGPFAPGAVFNRRLIPVVPRIARLRFQAVHTDDVAEAYRLAVVGTASGPFNIAADPVLDADELANALGARTVPMPAAAVRALAAVTWRARLQPTPPGWVDMALAVPLMDTSLARTELGWDPKHSSVDALLELLEGMRRGDGGETPPLDPGSSGPLRSEELRTGVGAREI